MFLNPDSRQKVRLSLRDLAAFAKAALAFYLKGRQTRKSPLHAGKASIMFASSFGLDVLYFSGKAVRVSDGGCSSVG